MLKLALRNIKSKPLRSVATILAIAVAVAMIFCMLSFKSAVFDYIFATETAKAGQSDIRISSSSSSDRIFDINNQLRAVDGVESLTKSLTLYALLNDEYVQLRGFAKGHLFDLQDIDVVQGDASGVNDGNDTSLVISQATAKHFGLEVGSRIELSIGNKSQSYYIDAISSQSGYFIDDAPYQFVGQIKGISRLLSSTSGDFCNEIYVKCANGADVNKVIEDIKQIEEYSNLLVKATKDGAYIQEQTDSLTAPVVLAGVAVLLLGVSIIVLLFMMSEKEKISLISKLSVVGATKKQLFAIFLIESAILAGIGVIVGSGLAIGLFIALLKVTLSSTIAFSVSTLKLFLSAVLGFVSAIASSVLPILRSFKSSIRETQLDVDKNTKWTKILPIVFVALTIVSVVVEFCVPKVMGTFAIVSLVLAISSLAICTPYAMRGVSKLLAKSGKPALRIAGINVSRTKRFSRTVVMFTVGVTVCVMLFMAWVMTTTVFHSYVADFENMVFVSNVSSNIDVSQFEQVDGVEKATKMVWKQGELQVANTQKTMNILGSADVLQMVDFEYITAQSTVEQLVSTNEPYVFVDLALQELYGVRVGDVLDLSVEGMSKQVVVGGILQHELFSGNYVVVSREVLDNLYNVKADTVLITVNGDMDATVGALRTKYADKNYYVIKTLDAYKWDMQSMDAVFDLIGTLAIVVAIFVFGVCVATTCIGRSGDEKSRWAMLNVGMSKNTLLKTEIVEHSIISLVGFVLSFAISVLLTSSLVHALRLFGLYFNFMYNAWVVAVVSGVIAMLYAIVPIVFKKGYTVRRK